MQNWSRVSADANPTTLLEQPSVNEALPARVGLATLHTLHVHYSSRDRDITVNVNAEGFGGDLLLLRRWLRRRRFHARQEFAFGLHRAVIVNEDDSIVEDRFERLGISRLVSLIPELFEGDDLRFDGRAGIVLGENARCKKTERAQKDRALSQRAFLLRRVRVTGAARLPRRTTMQVQWTVDEFDAIQPLPAL